jgi:acyl carrier protein
MTADDQQRGSEPSSPERPAAARDIGQSSASAPTPRTAAEIEQWMVTYLAQALDTRPEDVEVTVPFQHYALDSVQAVGMTGDLEEWLGYRIDPMVVYDYPTIESLSQYLSEQTGAATDSA